MHPCKILGKIIFLSVFNVLRMVIRLGILGKVHRIGGSVVCAYHSSGKSSAVWMLSAKNRNTAYEQQGIEQLLRYQTGLKCHLGCRIHLWR